MAWLCTCGNGSLAAEETPPEFCPVCGFELWLYFGEEVEL